MVTVRKLPQDKREEQHLRGNRAKPKSKGTARFSAVKSELGFKLRKGNPATKRRTRKYLKRKLG